MSDTDLFSELESKVLSQERA